MWQTRATQPREVAWAARARLALRRIVTYSWGSVSTFLAGHTKLGADAGPGDVVGQVLLSLCLLALVGWAVLRSRSTAANMPPQLGAGL